MNKTPFLRPRFLISVPNRMLIRNRVLGLAYFERWNCIQIQAVAKAQCSSSPSVVHIVRKGDTLTSISVEYGVPMHAIVAANGSIVDVDIVLEGQSLNIPVNADKGQKDSIWKNQHCHFDIRERCQSSLRIFGPHQNHGIFTILSSPQIHLAKDPGYILALVPLVLLLAFGIRCIVSAFHHRVPKKLKRQTGQEFKSRNKSLRSYRWKSVLGDISESSVEEAEIEQYPLNPPEDQSQAPFEDLSDAYNKLEPVYHKFLSDCGMSNWGYWRGGSPE